jgi:hypothetical protein
MWQGTIEEVLYYNYTTSQFLYVTTTLQNPATIFMQHKGTSYRAEMLHYLLFYLMSQMKELPCRLDKFQIGCRRA